MDVARIQAALRLLAKGLEELAAGLGDAEPGEDERTAALIEEWGERGLSQSEASALFRKHGFAPQTAGGWARGEWIALGEDGLRYLTAKSHEWLGERR
ncbi:hypothetical protein ACIBHX_29615 [Nonomuraea sp. NPDC050536]|uniref:hypothetical protein n=1 Tax=Nonomuraea sp. NPDC050536 TaxID=3364366 RepID=UPI0037C591E8